MQLHPYLALTPDPFTRLYRAWFWFVADMDFRHAPYWREQIRLCEEGVLSQHLGSQNMPADVRERREVLVKQQLGIAMREGMAAGTRRTHRGGVDMPESACF